MFRLRAVLVAAGLGAAVGAGAAEAPATVDEALIPNYARLTPSLAVAGQPTPEALARLRELGFRTVVNLRAESEPGVQAEAEAVRAAGLTYVSVPVTPETLSAADATAVRRVLDDPAGGPVLLHCGSSNRVGGVWAVIQAQAKGLTVEQALAEGEAAGLRSASMKDAVRRVLAPPAK
jgi:uncharacterized protein (TIGR01244 family)